MLNLTLLKTATELAISVGSSVMVKTVLSNATPENLKGIKKFCVPVAKFAIAGAIAKAAANYTNNLIDETHETIIGVRKGLDKLDPK